MSTTQTNAPVPSFNWNTPASQMPSSGSEVLVYTAENTFMICSHDAKGWWDQDRIMITKTVTYWCDLIAPTCPQITPKEF